MFPGGRVQKIYSPEDERYGPASPLNRPSPACGGSVSSSSEARRLTMGEVFLLAKLPSPSLVRYADAATPLPQAGEGLGRSFGRCGLAV